MHRVCATLLLLTLGCLTVQGQSSTPQATPSTSPSPSPSAGDSTSKQSQPDFDATPQAGTSTPAPQVSPPPPEKKSGVRRKLEELNPSCVNVGNYEKCKPSHPDKSAKSTVAPADREYAEDMDVGDFYLNEKQNYAGAAMRFRDALEQKPNDPKATFMLAESLEKLHRADEARQNYAAYLKLQPDGSFAVQAKKAIDRLQAQSADEAK